LVGRKPEKKPFGRDGPPRGYPKDQTLYADPENWRYPLHTSWHARAARRYFDDPQNRNKYSEEEQQYIDTKINQALSKQAAGKEPRKARARSPPTVSAEALDELSLEALLKAFLGAPRLQRAKEMDESLVSISQETSDVIEGNVKEYVVRIDLPNRTIVHDCQDWQNNMASKNMCKHLGKLFMVLDEGKAAKILREVLREKDQWSFVSPTSGSA
jgi:hypothetical protein